MNAGIAADKNLYNKVHYRCRLHGPEAVQHLKELSQSGDVNAQAEFMQQVVETKGTNIEGVLMIKKRKIIDEKESVLSEGWVPWRVAAKKEGHEELLEMVEAGTVEARRNPKLPASSNITYPFNQQVWEEDLKSKTRHTTRDEQTLQEAVPCDNAAHENCLKELRVRQTKNKNPRNAKRKTHRHAKSKPLNMEKQRS